MSKLLLVPTILRITLIIGLIGIAVIANTQNVAINNNGASANTSAMLDINSTTKGMLIPRMNSQQRGQIVTPAEGLIVYDTDTKGFWYYSNNTWNEIPKSIANGSGGLPTGPAGGDLSGNYPTPNVVKIQNLDVAFGVPLDGQVMKWDMLNNHWKGENDSLFLPYNSTFSSTTKLFGITNTSVVNGATAVYGKSGVGSGIAPGPITIGVWGDNSNGAGILGTSNNGTGTYGYSANNHGSYGFTGGIGYAGVYGSRVNYGPALMGDIYAAGIGVYGKSNGTSGKAAWFENIHTSNTDTVAKFLNKGTGINSYFINDNTNNTGALINGEHFGQGGGIKMKLWNAQNNNPGFYMYQYGNGDGLYVGSNKSKSANFYSNAGNTDTTVNISHDGNGMGLNVELNYSSNPSTAFHVIQKGVGHAANIEITNVNNTDNGLNIITQGKGYAATFNLWNANSTSTGVVINNIGKGKALDVQQTSSTYENAINVIHNGYGNGIYANSLFGHAISGESHVSDMAAVYAKNDSGVAISGTSNSALPAISGLNNGTGSGVTGSTMTQGIGVMGLNNAGTTGIAGRFENVSPTGTQNVLEVTGNGLGPSLFVENTNFNAITALAIFKKSGNIVARINGVGKGFFNGGTQTGGADMAEAFDVTGDRNNYESGDVLVISTEKDRAVEKSSSSYSTLVAGVYATKPGVLMTEENIDTDISDKVPMGVLGVIPTKVCIEGGEIKRGDILVTSSKPGVAMKADINKIKPGEIIGKALENFNAATIDKIKVLVNVK
jgi:hypothetical protein